MFKIHRLYTEYVICDILSSIYYQKDDTRMYNVIICDHHLVTSIQIERMIRAAFPNQFDIFTTDNPRLLVNSRLVKMSELDILIIDTEIGNYSGISIAESIRRSNPSTQIIFESIHHEYAQDIFRVSPVYFINKPVDQEVLITAVSISLEHLKSADFDYILLNRNGRIYQFYVRDILYIESSKRKVIVHSSSLVLDFYYRLDEVEALLPVSFLRCHQSYLVNMSCIRFFVQNRLLLKTGEYIPVSQSKQSRVRKQIEEYSQSK